MVVLVFLFVFYMLTAVATSLTHEFTVNKLWVSKLSTLIIRSSFLCFVFLMRRNVSIKTKLSF